MCKELVNENLFIEMMQFLEQLCVKTALCLKVTYKCFQIYTFTLADPKCKSPNNKESKRSVWDHFSKLPVNNIYRWWILPMLFLFTHLCVTGDTQSGAHQNLVPLEIPLIHAPDSPFKENDNSTILGRQYM